MEYNVKNQIEYIDVSLLKKSNKNPRTIKNKEFSMLCESIKNDPSFMELRPLLVDENNEIYAGNQRFNACLTLGWKKVPIIKTVGLTKEQKEERMLKDNLHSGEFDLAILHDEFNNELVKCLMGENVFDDLVEKDEFKVTDEKYIEDMELKNFENHDYVVFAFDDIRDFLFILEKFGISNVNCSFSPKSKKIGLGRVLNGKLLVDILRR